MLSHDLIQYIRSKAIAEEDLQRASIFTLDAIANALAGRNTGAGEKLLQWGSQQGADAGRHALVAGGLTHILETDDLHRASVTHPGCVVPPAVFCVAEREGSGGVEILSAILQGFEAMCRVGMGVGPGHYKIWHNTATCGPFGSVVAVAGLLELSNEQAVHAFGNAGTQSAGLWQFLETGAMSKHLHAGRAAEAGIVAADLAALDFTGPPAILEGEKGFFAATCIDATPLAVLAEPEALWQLRLTSIKPWPCCRHTHPAIDAALELHRTLAGRDIGTVQVGAYQAALDVCDRPQPASEYEAKFSLQHCVAVALATGSVNFESFSPTARAQVADLRGRIGIAAEQPYVSAYPASWGSQVTVITADGNTLSAQRNAAKGDPEVALSDEEMIAKAHMLLAYAGYSTVQAQWIVEGILGLVDGVDGTPEIVSYVCRQLRLQP